MAGLVDAAANFAANNPLAVAFGVILLVFIFGAYLLIRKTVTEFRRGVQGE